MTYADQQSVQNVCPHTSASVLVCESSKQMVQIRGSTGGVGSRTADERVKGRVKTGAGVDGGDGGGAGEMPAATEMANELSRNLSISLSLFQLRWRRSSAAASFCGWAVKVGAGAKEQMHVRRHQRWS